jgi:hypothetical protein
MKIAPAAVATARVRTRFKDRGFFLRMQKLPDRARVGEKVFPVESIKIAPFLTEARLLLRRGRTGKVRRWRLRKLSGSSHFAAFLKGFPAG